MSERERSMVRILFMVAGGVLGVLAILFWVVQPLVGYNKQITQLQNDLTDKDMEITQVLKDKKHLLDKWQPFSLPTKEDNAANQYETYVLKLMRDAGLDKDDWKPLNRSEAKGPPGQKQAKKSQHKVLSFSYRGKGTLKQLVQALDALQKTPVMHRVTNLTVERPKDKDNNPKLTFTMVLEAAIVNDAKPAQILGPEATAAQSRMDQDTWSREYAMLERKNVFAGELPPLPPSNNTPVEKGPPALDFVQLVSTTPTSNEAFLRNRLLPGYKLTRIGTEKGFQQFRIMNESATKEVLKGKVIRVDQRDVYFTVGEYAYGIHIGDTLAKAMRRPLSDKQLKEIGLFDIVTNGQPDKKGAKGDPGKTAVLKTTPLMLDWRGIYFMAGEDAFAYHFGDSLDDVLRRPLNDEQLREAGIYEIFMEELRKLDAGKKEAGKKQEAGK